MNSITPFDRYIIGRFDKHSHLDCVSERGMITIIAHAKCFCFLENVKTFYEGLSLSSEWKIYHVRFTPEIVKEEI